MDLHSFTRSFSSINNMSIMITIMTRSLLIIINTCNYRALPSEDTSTTTCWRSLVWCSNPRERETSISSTNCYRAETAVFSSSWSSQDNRTTTITYARCVHMCIHCLAVFVVVSNLVVMEEFTLFFSFSFAGLAR